jgi:hemolysin III
MTTAIDLPRPLPRADELANQVTHAFGFALSAIGVALLLRATLRYGDALQAVGMLVYGVSLIGVYASSTLSHTFEKPRLRHLFRTIDQVFIFLLIAGTFTPISLTYLREGWWWALFATVWLCAFCGVAAKLFLTRLRNVAISAYVLLGWLPVIAFKPIVAAIPHGAAVWILLGGLCYMSGLYFLLRDERVPYFHAVWHVLVMAGSACHFYALWAFVVPWPA